MVVMQAAEYRVLTVGGGNLCRVPNIKPIHPQG